MSTLNDQLQPTRKTVSEVNIGFSSGKIFVDNTFQRRSVWVTRNKIRLIESILTGYPMPEIYFWQQAPDPDLSGEINHSIVDGQQRLTAIHEYMTDVFKLNKSSLDTKHQTLSFVGKLFSELCGDDKNSIWNYQLNTRTLSHTVSRNEIVEIFLRLNETDKSLNPQELRNAKFNGKFIQAAEEVAGMDFWQKWNVFTPALIRRMTDINITSQFLTFFRMGLEGDITQRALNGMYDSFNETYRKKNEDIKACEITLNFIDEIFQHSEKVVSFFKSQTHFYALFIAGYIFTQRSTSTSTNALAKKLETFVEEYESDADSYSRYRLAANEGVLKRTNRDTRVNTISSILLA